MAELTQREIAFLAGGISAGLVVGAGVAHTVTKRKYQQLADQEIAGMKKFYSEARVVEQTKPDLNDLVDELGYNERSEEELSTIGPEEAAYIKETQEAAALASIRLAEELDGEDATDKWLKAAGTINVSNPEDDLELDRNVFEEANSDHPEWDYAREVKSRTDDRPFVIHKDEFENGELEYEQATLTYYEGDDVVADMRDSAIDDVDHVLGLDSLQKFGYGSGDANVVYVRNDRLQLDYEIVKSDGSFAEEVHGFTQSEDDSLQHSARRRNLRWDDED